MLKSLMEELIRQDLMLSSMRTVDTRRYIISSWNRTHPDFRFEICHFFRKAFCILTGYDRSLFNWSSHSIYMINITLQRYHFSFIIKN